LECLKPGVGYQLSSNLIESIKARSQLSSTVYQI